MSSESVQIPEISQESARKIFARHDPKERFNEIEQTPKRLTKTSILITILLALIAICILSIVLLTFIKNRAVIKHVWNQTENKLNEMYQEKPWAVFLTVFFVINFIIIMNVGFQSTLSILFCLIIQNYWYSFAILFFANSTADIVVYFTVDYLVCPCLLTMIKKNQIFKLIQRESKNKPFKAAFLTRFLFISTGLKNLILALIGISAQSYFFSAFVANFIFINLICIVSSEINDFRDMDKNNSWDQKSSIQKGLFFFTIMMIVFTIVVMIFLGLWARKNLKNQTEEKEIRYNTNEQEQIHFENLDM